MLFNVIVFVFVLGILVFFHELGHFIAAKACGIYCDRFSLGMPPRLFGIRIGETDYCVGALPVGGYVKMAGQEDVPRSEEERQAEYGDVPPERWFLNQPVWQRAIVLAAGPFMNLVLAVLLYALVAGVGAYVPESEVDTRIGYVTPGSSAATAPLYAVPAGVTAVAGDREPDAVGWQTGDRVLSIDGERAERFQDVARSALLGVGRTLDVEIERVDANGAVQRYMSPIKPEVLEGERHPRFGIEPFRTAMVGKVLDGMPAKTRGILPGDVITHVNGKVVDSTTFADAVTRMANGEVLDLRLLREDETIDIQLSPTVIGRLPGVAFEPPLYTDVEEELEARPEVIAAAKSGDTEEAEQTESSDAPEASGDEQDAPRPGLLRKDILLNVDGRPATVEGLRRIAVADPSASLTVEVLRPAIWLGLLRRESVETLQVDLTPVGVVGILWQEKKVFHRTPLAQVPAEGLRKSRQALDTTVRVLSMLVTGGLSPTDLGGPVMIFRVTAGAARRGYFWLLEITALISINLFIFNLLPLPVLDGGQLVFLGIEGIRRKPVSTRVAVIVQQVGLVLIIGLMLFVTFNDVRGWVDSIVP